MEGVARYVNDIENLKATELRLGLPGTEEAPEKQSKMPISRGSKRAFSDDSEDCLSIRTRQSDVETAPAAKVQIVGWPPIRSYRKNNFLQGRKVDGESTGLYVKVSMDGAPYLRKIDIKVYKGYKELREALEDMFKCFSLVSELSACSESDYAIAYEDKDGDLMLVGDVPWGMFINSCKRLRIMKGSEARGLGSS